jgi:hypothetical protein
MFAKDKHSSLVWKFEMTGKKFYNIVPREEFYKTFLSVIYKFL